jgi:hypothetical protein
MGIDEVVLGVIRTNTDALNLERDDLMSDQSQVWSRNEMEKYYGALYRKYPKLSLRAAKIPKQFWCLIPYAEFWGVSDDNDREELVNASSAYALRNLRNVVDAFDAELGEWLGGAEADEPDPSAEYIAFSAMRMAAYDVEPE